MITKYDPNQYVLIRARVRSVSIKPNKEATYCVEVADHNPNKFGHDEHIIAKESEIVCGWIGGDTK